MAEMVAESLPIGTVIQERYRVQAVVGRGGLGTVYQVIDLIYGKGNVYALKELADQSPGARKQFELECQWLQSLNHPNIPRFREYFEWHGRLYLVMDYVAGENLEQKLARLGGRGIPEQQAVAWTLPVCDALHYLHTRTPPILHRDLKPANIIVTPAGHPVLVDLGIAKEHLPGAGLTATFVRKAGTEGYAPPEQYTTMGQTGPWSDVYGIGATLYHLLTGCVPPTAVDRVALDARLIHPRDITPSISGQTDLAVCRALALRPADRFSNVMDFAAALMGAPVSLPADPRLPTGGPRPTPPHTVPVQALRTPGMPSQAPRTPSRSPGMPSQIPGMPPHIPGMQPRTPGTPSRSPSDLPPLGQPFRPPTVPPGGSQHMPAMPTPRPRTPTMPPPAGFDYALRDQQPLPPPRTPTSPGRPSSAALDAGDDFPLDDAGMGAGPHEDEEEESVRHGLTGGRLLLAAAALVVVLIVAAGGAFLLLSAPPDRTSPRSTVTGYFNALASQDYTRAWQFMMDSRGNASAQASDTQSWRADDQNYGKIVSVGTPTVDQTSPAQATVRISITRATKGPMTYTVQVSQADGTTWLISSITGS